ncbi:MAG: M1 family metallopeptidase [Flavobacteriaceae bacterium]|jgi:hypothetical protein|nr:M1 family metallopeptidase [Flavobacteriaceae bacterium]
MKVLLSFVFLSFLFSVYAQNPNPGYWQQQADYKMEVLMDVKTFQYKGTQELVYTNNSADTLTKVFYHLYPNAFQPGSEMDIRLQTVKDPDRRMVKTFKIADKEVTESNISTLKPNQIGYLKISNFRQKGKEAHTRVVGTVLEVDLAEPILPNSQTTFTLEFDGQVSEQIRRSGRNSSEGVALSMTQWYPKICAFDHEGWHADPYIGREFYGPFGDYDVKITIDKNYTIGGSGYLQNKNEIGHGYQDKGVEVKHPKKTKNLTWHFIAPNVHDFAWGADPDFIHDIINGENNVELHFLYKNDPEIIEKWKALQPKTAELLSYFNRTIGQYPYKQYSVIQGGDGGMEYAMCTLITGKRSLPSLVGVTAHELAHSWFQMILATNEIKHEWMDEGFTSFISDLAMSEIMPTEGEDENPFEGSYNSYFYMVAAGNEQPQTTHADRFEENRVYGISAYSKGTVFLAQLGYVIGAENLMKSLKRFYHDYKFSHPTPNDFKRTAERVSGAILDWYLVDWTQTTNTIDYGIKEIKDNGTVVFERIGLMPMPLDVLVVYHDGTIETFYIPLTLMRWEKENPYPQLKRTVLNGWDWAYPTYEMKLPKEKKDIRAIVIDPSELMADINKENNYYESPSE